MTEVAERLGVTAGTAYRWSRRYESHGFEGRQAGRLLARWMGEKAAAVGCAGACHGTMTQWIAATLHTIGITVELDDQVSPREASVAASAMLRLARWLGGSHAPTAPGLG